MSERFRRFVFSINALCTALLLFFPLLPSHVHAAPLTESEQTSDLFFNELQVVYLTNLTRREQGLGPLRWNRQMSEAARWFAQNSVDQRTGVYCGHTDTENRSPGDRLAAFQYSNAATWGENVVCGFAGADAAIKGWMNSEGHKQNILHPTYREIGVGYFRNATSGRGYIVQDFSYDPNYAPIVINNEAPNATSAEVQLYVYNPATQDIFREGLEGMSAAVEMMVANEPTFATASWEPFAQEKTWTLEAGEGWRTVYVKTRDAKGRTTLVSDSIYLGAAVPLETLNMEQASTISRELAFYNLDQNGWPSVQLSVNWQGDDSDAYFESIAGDNQEVSDPQATGGTVLQMGGARASHARYWTTEFYKNVDFTAYVRLKVSDNQIAEDVISLKIEGGGVTYGPLTIKGTDFVKSGEYQEFALPFVFHDNPEQPYLIFNLQGTGKSTIFVDTITVFTASMPNTTRLDWPVLGGYHRSRGIWGRFVDNAGKFSNATELIPNATTVLTTPVPAPTVVPVPTSVPTPTPTPTTPVELPPTQQLPYTVLLPVIMK